MRRLVAVLGLLALVVPVGRASGVVQARVFALQYASSLSVVLEDGSLVHRFSGVTASALSPDGSRVAIQRSDGLHISQIDGSSDRRVDPGPWTDLTWNRSGLYALNEVYLGTEYFPGPLTKIDPDGIAAAAVLGAHSTDVSPDGRFVVDFAADGIGLRDVSGHNAQTLAHVATSDWPGGWSPDGTRLGVNVDSVPKIFTLTSGTVASTQLQHGTSQDVTPPYFTADGQETYLAPLWANPDDGNEYPAGLEVADAAGNNPRTLINDTSLLSFSAGGGTPFTPDTVPPAAIANPTAAPAPESETLRWTLPADTDFAGADIRYTPGPIGPATPGEGTAAGSAFTQATLTRLAADTTYTATLFPRDWSGNTGPPTMITFKTEHQRVVTATHPGGMFAPLLGSRTPAIARFSHADRSPIVGLRVRVVRQINDHPARRVATLTTDSRGQVAWRQRWTQPTTLTFTSGADANNTASTVDVFALTQPRFAVKRPRDVRAGHPFRVVITGPPNHGITVDFARFRDIQPRTADYLGELAIGSYDDSSQPTFDHTGRMTLTLIAGRDQPRGRWEIQIRQSVVFFPPGYYGPEPFQKFAITVT